MKQRVQWILLVTLSSAIVCVAAMAIVAERLVPARVECACGASADTVEDAALYALPSDFNMYGIETSLDEAQLHRKRVASVRAWADGLQDVCARNAYATWLDFYDRQLDGAETSIRTGEKERSGKLAETERRAKEEQRRAFMRSCSFPVPPRSLK